MIFIISLINFTLILSFVLVFMIECTAQKLKFSIKDFFSKCYQIRRKLRIWSHLLKISSRENFIFCVRLQENMDQRNPVYRHFKRLIKYFNKPIISQSADQQIYSQDSYSACMSEGFDPPKLLHEVFTI